MSRHLRRTNYWLLVMLAVVGTSADAQSQGVVLRSPILMPPVPVTESPAGVVVFSLSWMADDKGEGKGTFTLDPNKRTFNEFGDPVSATEIAEKTFECTVKYVKTGKVKAGPPGLEQDWFLYEIKGPKITTGLTLAVPNKKFEYGRLLVHQNGQVAFVVGMRELDKQPCHPGCFPAGTPVVTSKGVKPIESIKVGDVVTTVRSDGVSATGTVQSVFVTNNQLMKVETTSGELLTTATQPLCLTDGEFCAVGELKVGDMIYSWKDGQRQIVKVLRVTQTPLEAKVFNLVLGDNVVFIAGGFLVRSKPPGALAQSTPSTLPAGPGLPSGKNQ